MTHQPDTNDPDAIQHRIRQLRAWLLGGRGRGASPDEIARWQRDRPLLGAQPAPAERQQVADQAILARSDREEIEHLIVRRRADLAALAGQLRDRADAALRVAGPAALAGAVAGVAITVAAGTALRHHRGAPP